MKIRGTLGPSSYVKKNRIVANASNIVVIVTDDQEAQSLAYMPKVSDRLISHGLTFKSACCQFPLCCPSRATMLTGQQSNNHRIYGNNSRTLGGFAKFKLEEDNSLAPWLGAAGYRTGHVGKYLNGYHRFPTHVPVGWDSWQATASGGAQQYYDWTLNDNGTLRVFGAEEGDYSTDVFAALAVAFIAVDDRRPFYLEVTPFGPHFSDDTPYRAIAAPRHIGLFADKPMPMGSSFNEADVGDKPAFIQGISAFTPAAISELTRFWRERMEALQAVDDLVADIVCALQATSKLDNTIIIFTADHGWSQGDHRYVGKTVCYENSLRVPLVMRGPNIPQNAACTQLATNVDVVASIVDLAGANPGRTLDGRSLAPIFADTNVPWRSAFFIQGMDEHSDNIMRWRGVRTATRKYVFHSYGNHFEELYDLTNDPDELENRVNEPAYAADLAALRALTEVLKTASGADCWVADDEDLAGIFAMEMHR